MVKRVAIACQGGGSHTAFTAGALQRILEEKDNKFEITALSGTSGGAVCALLTWYSLVESKIETGDEDKGKKKAIERLNDFWNRISLSTPWERSMNFLSIEFYRSPFSFKVSPYAHEDYPLFYWYDFSQILHDTFKSNLEACVRFDKIKKYFHEGLLKSDSMPELIVGATNIHSGDFKAFKSTKEAITADMILASAAEPNFFKAVNVDEYLFSWDNIPGNDNRRLVDFLTKNYDGTDWVKKAKIEKIDNYTIKLSIGTHFLLLSLSNDKTKVNLKIDDGTSDKFKAKIEGDKLNIYNVTTCWDGLFSRNPPISAILEGKEAREKPDEIWIIQIDPQERKPDPKSFIEIEDRRNELSGNLSLEFELHFIDVLNYLIDKYFSGRSVEKYKKIEHKQIEISPDYGDLDYASKWRLDPGFIHRMMDYGRKEAERFLI